jgi:hypothetical protein
VLISKGRGRRKPDLSRMRNRGEIPATIVFLAELSGLKYKNVPTELRVKQDRVNSIQHELRYIAIFHNAAGRTDHNKLIPRTPEASK